MRLRITGGESTPLRFSIEIEDWEELLQGAQARLEEAIVSAALETVQETAKLFGEELKAYFNRPSIRFTGQLASTISWGASIPSPPPDEGLASRAWGALRAFGKRVGVVPFRPDLEARLGEIEGYFGMIRSPSMKVTPEIGKNPYHYATPVEFGSSPPAAGGISRVGRLRLQAWAEARGFPKRIARRIIGGIVLHGTRARGYFSDASTQLEQIGSDFFRRTYEDALARRIGS